MITQYRPAYYDNPRASTLSGLSTDQKPTDVENGARYEEIDTGKTFCFDKENKAWYEMPQSGGGGSSVSVEPITITKNGVTTAPDGVAYSPITTDTYTQDGDKITITEDDGSKVVFTQGEAQAEKTVAIAKNGAFTVEPDAGYSSVRKVNAKVNVPAPVTSVNGKTGDVKTGMVVNFTLDTSQSENITSDVPFADALAFINGNTKYKPYIQFTFDNEGDVLTFNQYYYDSDAQSIFICGGYSMTNTSLGTSSMLRWSANGIKSADVSSAMPIVFDLNSSDNSVSVQCPNGFIEEALGIVGMLGSIAYGPIPSMVLIDGATKAMYSGLSGNTFLFTSPYIDGVRKVVKATFDGKTQSINWTVEEENIIPKVHIVHANIVIGGTSTADATFQQIRGWLDNNEVVLLSNNGTNLFPIAPTKTTSNEITFEVCTMLPTGFILSDIILSSDNTWSSKFVDCTNGFQYASPSGKKFTISVADDGTLSTKEVTA